tara:strand:- start:340 stop:594 length:255 start_codon:yes stop_codon:yes gene_type:complete
MNKWFVYIVECSDGTLYTGITTDLHRRLLEHNYGSRSAKYTRSRRPVKMLWNTEAENRSEASKKEARIKKMTRAKKLDMIKKKD